MNHSRWCPGFSRRLPLLLACWLVLPALTRAHDAHDSIAEATLNRDSQRLEVTLSVHAADLERALSAAAQLPVSLEKDDPAALDPRILAYLAAAFRVRDDQGTALPLEWVGREPGADPAHQTLLLHFAVVLPATSSALTLHQRTFCELHADQINLVEFRDGDRKQTLGFSPQHGARTIPL